MKIGIDARFAVKKRRGIGIYTLKLIQHLAKIDKNNQYILYLDQQDLDQVLPCTQNFQIKVIKPQNYLIWEQILLSTVARKDGLDILHCTANTAPLFLDRSIKLVVTIHDIMYLYDSSIIPQPKSLYQKMGKLYRKTIVPLAIKRLNGAITVSKYSREDILRFFSKFPQHKVFITYEAADEKFQVVDKKLAKGELIEELQIAGPYILTLAALDPRKNTEMIIKAFIRLYERKILAKHKLVLVGLPDWKKTKYHELIRNAKIEEKIIFTGFVSERQILNLYNCADVFLYPSLYEGFGLPVLEAMACGTPVITSTVTSIPEIAGDAALLIDANSQEELEESIQKIIVDKELQKIMIDKGLERVKKFSWSKMAEQTLTVYNILMKDK